MSTLDTKFKRTIADLFNENKMALEEQDAEITESFARQVLALIAKEKKKTGSLHDLELLEYNMGLLKNFSRALQNYELDTDEYDFTKNDCKNLIASTKKWLTLEGLV
ncbi:MAG: hypothetical protein NWF03_02115 [Candidatus Bathyarchaeota archaeon]|nr:hypothetical protein [Candidatus Bathyarchaeota archaeon]